MACEDDSLDRKVVHRDTYGKYRAPALAVFYNFNKKRQQAKVGGAFLL